MREIEEKFAKRHLRRCIENATRTESIKSDKITVNNILLTNALGIFIMVGDILDQIKKNAFYGKPYNYQKIFENLDSISTMVRDCQYTDIVPLNDEIAVNERMFHSIMGIMTEAAELGEAMNDGFPDDVNVLEEFFDLDWYKFIGIDEMGGDQVKIWETGFNKLRARYPEKFSSKRAIERDIKAEREILDTLEK